MQQQQGGTWSPRLIALVYRSPWVAVAWPAGMMDQITVALVQTVHPCRGEGERRGWPDNEGRAIDSYILALLI